jgi:uncharacterized protein (TIGR03435 family)
VKVYQVNGPAWLNVERYDIAVKVPAGATKEQVNIMWQNLLAERFRVKLHHEPKDFQVEDLVVAKGGPKLKESAEDDPDAAGPPVLGKNGQLDSPGLIVTITMSANGPNARAYARAQPLSKLTAMLGNQLNHPVLDKTGLTGKYDFNVEFTVNLPGPAAAAPGDTSTEPGSRCSRSATIGLKTSGE